MKPVLHSSQNQTRAQQKRELQANILKKFRCKKSSLKYCHTGFNNILKTSYTTIKLVSSQECRDGSTHQNHSM
jgi:hypothetical protein